jgi:UDP-N-acetyl-D-glucosamine/UDP-N-acetyl-D-galactosamine dehydrogenase
MSTPTLCIVGLGYVGLPLAHAFARAGYRVLGYDLNTRRIEGLKNGDDWTNELSAEQLKAVKIEFSDDPKIIAGADVVIVALPTPVDDANKPDLSILQSASRTIGEHLKPGTIVVYESTVYPGVTEDICGPILAEASGLECGKDFMLGYSPERINPGDKTHTVDKIVKIVAGQDAKTLDTLAALYGSVVTAGIHKAPSIKVAEMAKAIENAQRDLNIAYMNEVSMLCNHLGIRTKDVLEAAGTKWNFLKFQPGLVGGHCIGVDPYYLVEKARQLGMDTHLITAGRRINDGMGAYVADRVAAALPVEPGQATVLVLGLTFKENVPDTRNSKVVDVIKALKARGCRVHAHDPYVDSSRPESALAEPGTLEDGPYHAVLLLVPHKEYMDWSPNTLAGSLADGGVFFDLKSLLGPAAFEDAGKKYLAL